MKVTGQQVGGRGNGGAPAGPLHAIPAVVSLLSSSVMSCWSQFQMARMRLLWH